MKHLLNNLTEEEKNHIRDQHTGGMNVVTENFSRLIKTKSGDVKPLVSEQPDASQPTQPTVETQNFDDFMKSMENNPVDFYNRLQNDKNFKSEVLKSFEQNFTDNYDKLEQFRLDYFLPKGAAMVSSGSPKAPREVKKGIKIKDLQHYNNIMNAKPKDISYVTSFLPTDNVGESMQRIITLIFSESEGTYNRK